MERSIQIVERSGQRVLELFPVLGAGTPGQLELGLHLLPALTYRHELGLAFRAGGRALALDLGVEVIERDAQGGELTARAPAGSVCPARADRVGIARSYSCLGLGPAKSSGAQEQE